jgi:hypothetical protein
MLYQAGNETLKICALSLKFQSFSAVVGKYSCFLEMIKSLLTMGEAD